MKSNRMKNLFIILLFVGIHEKISSQTCFGISNRTNGNGQSASCGIPNCSGNGKTGHIEINFGSSCPLPIPSLVLTAVSSGPMPNPFCFDPGTCQSPGIVRYCFRGTNLPSAGSMTLRFTSGLTSWSCNYLVGGGSGTILPVHLSYFTAKVDQQSVLIKWRTEQETNNDKFEIERSDDGRSYKVIGSVKGTGNSSLPVDYEYKDLSSAKGILFYRLRQVDIDGQSTYSSVQRIDNRIDGFHVKELYPNPARQSANLSFTADHSTAVQVKIINVAGVMVNSVSKKVNAGEHTWPIDVSRFAAGIYQVIITTENGKTVTERLMVQ